MRGQQLIDYVIDRFDGSIVQDNKWRVNGSNGNHYWVECDPFINTIVVDVKDMLSDELVDISKKFKQYI